MTRQQTAFGAMLRRLRTAAGLSQEALAERAGLSARGISDLERGARNRPYLNTVRLISDALALDPAEREALVRAALPRAARFADDPLTSFGGQLPAPLTSLIGRGDEIEALSSLVGGGNRLVTVTGAGGTGKTRLALEVGARQRDGFPDGVIFVDLAPLTDAGLVVPAIARAVGVEEWRGQRLSDTLGRRLAAKRVLLIVDNVEHVIAAAADIAALMAASPRVVILATSREALRVRGEREFHLGPLPLPRIGSQMSHDAVAASPAVALFAERAAAVQPGFALTPENAAAVAEVCRRLDGLPLAIELAAARARLLSPQALLERLDTFGRRLDTLSRGPRDLPARQQTMRDAVAWSYDLLGDGEQQLFRRLAVFAGGWTFDAAECACPELDVLSGLDALVAASLARTMEQPNGERRLAMLETVREFGLEQLAAHGEMEEAGRCHARYFAALAQTGEGEPAVADRGAWHARVEAEQDNLRTALAWLRDRQEGGSGLRLASALGEFWRMRSRNAEGRAWLETFLARTVRDESAVGDRIVALRWAGELAGLHGDPALAQARLRESLELARATGDALATAGTLGAIGSSLLQSGDVVGCIPAFMEAIGLARDLGNRRQLAFLSAYVAVAVGRQGDVAAAEALVAESEAVLRDLGDTVSFEASLAPLVRALLALMCCDHDGAENAFATAFSRGAALDAKAITAFAAAGLGEIDLGRGRDVAAAQHFRDGLAEGWDGDFPLGIAWNLAGMARISARRGALERAARICGAVDVFREALRALPMPVTAAYEADRAWTQRTLGDEAFLAQWAAGRTAQLEDVVAAAARVADLILGEE